MVAAARMRAAAEMALNACRRKVGPTDAPKQIINPEGNVPETLTPRVAPPKSSEPKA